MVEKFEEGKKYKFSIELYAQDFGLASKDDPWAQECEGEEVTVMSADRGNCKGRYWIVPEWCEEVQDAEV